MDGPVVSRQIAGALDVRPGHRQGKEDNARRAQEQEEQVLQAQDPMASANCAPQEVHRGPFDHAIPPPIQKMNQDRPCRGQGAQRNHGERNQLARDNYFSLFPNLVARLSILPSWRIGR